MAIRPRAPERGIEVAWPVAALGSMLPVVDAVSPSALKVEIDALPPGQRLVDSGGFHVYWAHAGQIRCVLQEIGRLRELTFRSVGEGSGKCSDVDEFDTYYLHLFVWDAQADAIVGAYRLGLVEEILAQRGKRGLYTHSLFRYGPRILNTLKPAIELGRSFVRVEYQRSFAPMLLLWRGIGRFVERAPQYAVLFGPVSISNNYSAASRELMVQYLSEHMAESGLVTQVRPRRPFERRAPGDRPVSFPATIDELSRMIEQLEPDRKGIPVLLRQYLRLGARILAFNVDGTFGNVLDGLMVVDLRDVEPPLMARYMGAAGMRAFRAYHGLDHEPAAAPASWLDRAGRAQAARGSNG
jgi:putative hemolysin